MVPDGHHNIRQTGGHHSWDISLRAVRLRQAIGGVQRGALRCRDVADQLRRRHIHPDSTAPDGDVQFPGLRMGRVVAVADLLQLPQQGEGRHGSVAAQVHLPGGGEIAQGYGAVRLHMYKGRLRVLHLRSDLPHGLIRQLPVRQCHARLVAAEDPIGKGVHHIDLHRVYLPVFLVVFIIYSLALNGKYI